MYAYIKGKIEYKSSNYVVVDNMGIGYKIYMGDSAINTLGDIGEDVKIFTHSRNSDMMSPVFYIKIVNDIYKTHIMFS